MQTVVSLCDRKRRWMIKKQMKNYENGEAETALSQR
jgi:hypothetical protein